MELHDKLLGVVADEASPDVRAAFDLFVEVWERARQAATGTGDFRSLRCDVYKDDYYFDFIAEDIWRSEPNDTGDVLGLDWDRVNAYFDTIDWSDPHHVAQTWVVVLAYLLTDYRYLHL